MPRRFDINYMKLLLEFLSVLLGVLLAFGASEWQEEREKNQRAEKALTSVYHELERNHRILGLIHKNNAATVAAMHEEGDADEDMTFIPGIQLQSDSWETIKTTGIGHYIPYQTMVQLSKTYAGLGVYVSTSHKLTESSMTMSAIATVLEKEIDDQEFQTQFLVYFDMIAGVEKDLLEAIQATMQYLQDNHEI